MPIYEYRCASCGHELELMQKISDPAPAPCPKCGNPAPLEKLLSRSSFQLKGGGWYSDLYASSKKESSSTATPAAGASSTPSAGSSTTAPASAGTSTSSPSPSSGSSSGSSSGGTST
jgi:putative FmdB family regulatory protein